MKVPSPMLLARNNIGTVFYVPNDADGHTFLELASKFLNRTVYSMRVRGRNAGRKQFAAQFAERKDCTPKSAHYRLRLDLPREYATYFAVYLPNALFEKEYKRLFKLNKEIASLQAELEALKADKDNLLYTRSKLQAEELRASAEKLMLRFSKRKIEV